MREWGIVSPLVFIVLSFVECTAFKDRTLPLLTFPGILFVGHSCNGHNRVDVFEKPVVGEILQEHELVNLERCRHAS